MSGIAAVEVPRPKDWQSFERIVLGALSLKWKNTHFVKNGRDGQSQKGVDIIGEDASGRAIGVQCKHTKRLDVKVILSEVEKAEKFKGGVFEFYIATSAEHDALVQEKVREESGRRVRQGKFPILLLFWDDIVAALALDKRVFSLHLPGDISPKKPVSGIDSSLYGAWELGYHGGTLKDDLELISGEIGWMGGADPDELYSRIRIVQRRIGHLLPVDDAADIDGMLIELKSYLSSPSGKNYNCVSFIANRAARRIRDASSLLSRKKSLVMDLGVALKRLY
ncbi:hypothetical protein [Pseudomonas taiwanensis]|uniref:Restriction endonuclease type IV Mrr domain-containing protein n=1 Tax=Pseudomonas taiwanensis TaxID=470150 RepID=A0ABR6V3E8_9PSED|nr:hypothetical protein [Pseudomonas taiwanensis]MBC3474991.1 hypothetical protein [Pseudomonas taiwanensis]